jgi:pyridoxamine 5'-phosphate oxidase
MGIAASHGASCRAQPACIATRIEPVGWYRVSLKSSAKFSDSASPDPFARFSQWLAEARRARAPLPDAMAVATADTTGNPSVRTLLLASANRRGFVFYTHALSRKARELAARPRAALVFYWHRTGKQVRVEGRVTQVTRVEADSYWRKYPHDTQLATLALDANVAASRRVELVSSFAALRRYWRGKKIQRPVNWVGYRLTPDSYAFWHSRAHRLNDGEIFFRTKGRWRRRWLPP